MSSSLSTRPRFDVQLAAAYAALIGSITAFCVGTSFAKRLFPLVGAEATSAYRVGFAALILLTVWRPWRGRVTRADLFATMRYGAAMGMMNLCFYMALRTIPLGLAIAIEFSGPLAVSLLHARRPAHFAMVGLAVAGLALLLPIGPGDHGLDPVGIMFALGAGLCWALYILFGKRLGHLPGGQSVSIGMATAALIVVPIGIHQGGLALLDPRLMALGLGAAILSSAIPYSLEMVALKRLSHNSFGIFLSLEPAAGALAGVALLGEHLTALQWLAVLLVVMASAGTMLSAEPSEAPPSAGS
jgi:inner membrane transporter RhtA